MSRIVLLGSIASFGILFASSPIFAGDSSEEGTASPTSIEGREELSDTGNRELRRLVDAGRLDEALERTRRRIAEGDPDRGALRLLEARLLDRTGDPEGAIRTYRRVLSDSENGERARAELHELYVQRGYFEAADRLTADAAEPGPGVDLQDLKRRGYSMTVQGEYATAARILAGLAETDHQAAVLRANALLALGERDAAEKIYLRVLETEQDPLVRQLAHFGLGQVARLRGGRAVRAIQDEKAVRLGEAAWAELDWGLALRALGRRVEARERLEKALTTNADLAPTARLALARLDEEEGRVDAALEHLAAALEGGLSDFLAWTRIGDLLLQEAQEDHGIEAYRQALELFPGFPPARDRLARALAARGRWEEVPDSTEASDRWSLPGWTWERLLDGDLPFYETVQDRTDLEADDSRRFVLGLVQYRAGFPAGTLGWIEETSDPLYAALRAQALERVGRADEAEEVWRTLVGGPASALALEALARVAYARDPEEGRAAWDALFAEHPDARRARIRYARTLEADEDWAQALEQYTAASTEGWLTSEERRRIRVAREDLEDLLQEEEDLTEDEEPGGEALPGE